MRIPKKRPPTRPGEVLREDFLKPLGMTQEQLAEELGVSFQREKLLHRSGAAKKYAVIMVQ